MRDELLEAIRHLMQSVIFLPKDTPKMVVKGLLDSIKDLINVWSKMRDR